MAACCCVPVHRSPGNLSLQSSLTSVPQQPRRITSMMATVASNCFGNYRVQIYQAGNNMKVPVTEVSALCPCECISSSFVQVAHFRFSAAHQRSIGISAGRIGSSSFQSNGLYDGGAASGRFRRNSTSRKNRKIEDGNLLNEKVRKGYFVCNSSNRSSVGSVEWMSLATPYEVLGVSADCSEEDVKAAFRMMIKEYHPDVYQGPGDADAITQRLLRAYELLTDTKVEQVVIRRKSMDPFEEPDCVATNLFVNELDCIGRGCPYSCVDRAPSVFQFAPDTGRARVVNQDLAIRQMDDYDVQLAVGQCPNSCIHTLTAEQRLRLEEILQSILEGAIYSSEVVIMDGLIARAKFENGRYQPPKRRPKRTEKWVDWF